MRRSFAAIFTRPAREAAIILPRCAFTVISLIPSSPATCLFNLDTYRRHSQTVSYSKCAAKIDTSPPLGHQLGRHQLRTSILMQRIVKKCAFDVDSRRPGGVERCETLLADKDHR